MASKEFMCSDCLVEKVSKICGECGALLCDFCFGANHYLKCGRQEHEIEDSIARCQACQYFFDLRIVVWLPFKGREYRPYCKACAELLA